MVVIHGSPYDEGKIEFIDELRKVMSSWHGPIIFGGDFNFSRFASDRSNGNINQKWANCFNDWVNRWGLIEINPTNRKFTWSNKQENLVSARFFVTTDWDTCFPLATAKALFKDNSDHYPLLIDIGNNVTFGKKIFRFEKWWMERAEFKDIVSSLVHALYCHKSNRCVAV